MPFGKSHGQAKSTLSVGAIQLDEDEEGNLGSIDQHAAEYEILKHGFAGIRHPFGGRKGKQFGPWSDIGPFSLGAEIPGRNAQPRWRNSLPAAQTLLRPDRGEVVATKASGRMPEHWLPSILKDTTLLAHSCFCLLQAPLP